MAELFQKYTVIDLQLQSGSASILPNKDFNDGPFRQTPKKSPRGSQKHMLIEQDSFHESISQYSP